MMDLDRVNNYLARVEESEKTTFKPVGSRLRWGWIWAPLHCAGGAGRGKQPRGLREAGGPGSAGRVVVDYTGALRIVRSLKERLEARLGTELVNCAIAMPAGTESSVKTHQYVAEGAGLEVTNILDEPSAANAIYQIEDGVVVDIGGGTTGLAILKEGKVVQIEDEPTGGTHLTLVLSGNYHVSFEEAEAIKQDYKRHREILPVVRPVVEKMATIVSAMWTRPTRTPFTSAAAPAA